MRSPVVTRMGRDIAPELVDGDTPNTRRHAALKQDAVQ